MVNLIGLIIPPFAVDESYHFIGIVNITNYTFDGDGGNQESNGWGKFNNINGTAGIVFGGVEAFSNSAKVVDMAHDLGIAGATLGFFTDLYGVYNYKKYGPDDKNHFIVSPTKMKVNTGIAVYSLSTGPPGWTVSSIYFAIDATIGWENAIPSYIEVEDNKQTMRDHNIMTFSDFK